MKAKKIILLFMMIFVMILNMTACGKPVDRTGQAKTPSGSSDQKGKNYTEVIGDFEKEGFTNIQTEIIDDLILGWLVKDGAVESVSVGGDVDYSSYT